MDDDVAALVRHWGDKEVRRYLWDDQPVTMSMVNDVVNTSDADFKRHGYGIWALRLNLSDAECELCGICGLRSLRDGSLVEMLFSLRPRYWKQGLASEAARGIARYAFQRLGLPQIVASVDEGNAASEAVLRRLSMSYFQHLDAGSGSRPYWAITREQFLATSEPPPSDSKTAAV